MLKGLLIALSLTLCSACSTATQSKAQQERAATDRERDGLLGPVKAVLTDDVVFGEKLGGWRERQQVSSTTIYDAAGRRMVETPFRIGLANGYAMVPHDAQYDPQAKGRTVETQLTTSDGGSAGKWVKTYDTRGYLTEKTRYDASGSLLEKHSVAYEYDSQGNWVKRTVTNAVGNGRPSETSYRLIIYFRPAPSGDEKGREAQAPESARQLKNPIVASSDNVASGRLLYNQRCASCHGEKGKAEAEAAQVLEIKPADLTGKTAREMTDGEIYWVITHGIKTSRMPAQDARISENERWQIALYVRTLQSDHPVPEGQREVTAGSAPGPKPSVAKEQRYQLKGKIVSVDQQQKLVTIEHETIEGYMEAMTMPFPLKDEKLLGVIKANDRIRATLVIKDGGGWWLENVRINEGQ